MKIVVSVLLILMLRTCDNSSNVIFERSYDFVIDSLSVNVPLHPDSSLPYNPPPHLEGILTLANHTDDELLIRKNDKGVIVDLFFRMGSFYSPLHTLFYLNDTVKRGESTTFSFYLKTKSLVELSETLNVSSKQVLRTITEDGEFCFIISKQDTLCAVKADHYKVNFYEDAF